jgi:hypothetical protein
MRKNQLPKAPRISRREPLAGARLTLLQKANDLIHGPRQADYGHPRDDFGASSAMMTAFLKKKLKPGCVIEPEDIPMIMIMVKLARQANKPQYDNVLDIAGYCGTWDLLSEDPQEK